MEWPCAARFIRCFLEIDLDFWIAIGTEGNTIWGICGPVKLGPVDRFIPCVAGDGWRSYFGIMYTDGETSGPKGRNILNKWKCCCPVCQYVQALGIWGAIGIERLSGFEINIHLTQDRITIRVPTTSTENTSWVVLIIAALGLNTENICVSIPAGDPGFIMECSRKIIYIPQIGVIVMTLLFTVGRLGIWGYFTKSWGRANR